MCFNRAYWRLLIWLLVMVVAAPPAHAQAKKITLALVKALPDSLATARIVREPGAKGRTIILLREANVDVVTVATALNSLDRSLKSDGDELNHQMVITIRGLRSLSSVPADEQRLAEDWISRLQKTKLQELPGFGSAKVLVVTVAEPRPKSSG
ncbi:MAG TPA: hypothetical protein VJN70_07845 [Gemmatimonadaceae bacterium]|nr:hypothetical protein [Gemmatimonadaceae bacterium]